MSATKNSWKQERKKVSNLQKQKREEDKRQNKRKEETRDQMSEKRKNVEWDDCTDFIEFFFISILSCSWKQTVFFHRPLTNTLRNYIADRSKILTFRSSYFKSFGSSF